MDEVAKHTPGPWEDVGANAAGERCIYGADDSGVAVTIPVGQPDSNTSRSSANACLITAAPDLLAACCAVYEMIFADQIDLAIIGEVLHQAIAKATPGPVAYTSPQPRIDLSIYRALYRDMQAACKNSESDPFVMVDQVRLTGWVLAMGKLAGLAAKATAA